MTFKNSIAFSLSSRIVPSLVKECINSTMVPFVLPVILLVAERATKEEFVEHILPHLKPIMKLTEPVQVLQLWFQICFS